MNAGPGSKWLNANRVLSIIMAFPSFAVILIEFQSCIVENTHIFVLFILWIVGAISLFLSVIEIFKIIFHRDSIVCKTQIEINNNMRKIIRKNGNTCILSRNLSWVSDEIESDLLEKSRKGDLTIFVNEESELVGRLSKGGAMVHIYEKAIPRCRFTIKNYKGNYPTLYIADLGSSNNHVIHEHSGSNNLMIRLAEDLAHFLENKS